MVYSYFDTHFNLTLTPTPPLPFHSAAAAILYTKDNNTEKLANQSPGLA